MVVQSMLCYWQGTVKSVLRVCSTEAIYLCPGAYDAASSKCAVSFSNTALEEFQMSPDTRYEIILYWSEEDRAVIAEVPELPGCAADGATYQEALANVQTIITEWIETAQEMGRAIPQPKGRLMFA